MTGRRGLLATLAVLLLVAGCADGTPSDPAASPDAVSPDAVSPASPAATPQEGTPMPTGSAVPPSGDQRASALALLLEEVALLADTVDATDLRQEVEACDGGMRLGLGIFGGMAGEGTSDGAASGAVALEALVDAYRDRWQAAGWDPQVREVEDGQTTQVSATPGDGTAIDLLVASDRGGLAVRTACTSADALAPSDHETALLAAEVHAAEVAGAVLGSDGATGETDQTACGPGWQQTTVTFRGPVADEDAAIGAARRAMRTPVPLATHSLLDADPGGGLVVATALDGRLIVRVWAPCHRL